MINDLDRQQRRRESTREPFERLCMPYLGLRRFLAHGGSELPVFRRLDKALTAYREFRHAHNQDLNMGDGELNLCVRVVADQFASDIAACAGAEQDAETIAWVLAGLRCPRRPFCQGCVACFTITTPMRPHGQPERYGS